MTALNPHGSSLNHHILSVLVQNRPGVLARVASLFARRGYNIYSLAVAPAEEDGMSRITVVVGFILAVALAAAKFAPMLAAPLEWQH